MLKIGEFASLTGISIHMLRNYDKIGLLSPALVDPVNGYRSYEAAQILRARQIQILKELGFGLSEIAAMLADSDAARKKRIRAKIAQRELEQAVRLCLGGIDLPPRDRETLFGYFVLTNLYDALGNAERRDHYTRLGERLIATLGR